MKSTPSNNLSSPRKSGSNRLLKGRILLGVVSLVLILIAAWGLVNVHAISTYNQAARSLNTSIAELSRSGSDPTKIAAIQEQAEQLFRQAQSLSPILLPKTRQAIEEGKTVSTKFSRTLRQENKALGKNMPGGKEGGAREGSNKTSGGKRDKTGLTQEQEKKVEELLQQNQQAPSSSPSPGTQTGENKKSMKPW